MSEYINKFVHSFAEQLNKNFSDPLRRIFIIIMLSYSIIIFLLIFWIYQSEHTEIEELAKKECTSSFQKDLDFRHWATMHGGVYAPVTETTPPNKYLSGIAERDLLTPSGRKLTLINPAYMMRQLYERTSKRKSLIGHITSLNPLRPENGPDKWERAALYSFEKGREEFFGFDEIGGLKYARFMAPLKIEQGCLKCHAGQGYKVGDIRGGISVATLWSPYGEAFMSNFWVHFIGYGGLWILGLAGLFYSYKKLSRKSKELRDLSGSLLRGEKKYRTIFNSLTDLYLKIDGKGIIELVSPSVEKITGHNPVQLIGEYVDILFLDHQSREKLILLLKEKRTVDNYEIRFVKMNGAVITVSANIVISEDESGSYCGFEGIFRDITEQKVAGLKLLESEELYRTTLYSIGDGVISTDRNGRIQKMNQVAEKLTGSSENDSKEKILDAVFNIIEGDSRIALENPAKGILSGGDIINLSNRTILISADGGEIPVSVSGSPILDSSNKISGMILVFKDQSEQYASQKRLLESEEKYRTLIEVSADAVFVNKNNRIIYLNPAALKLFGANSDEQILGKSPFDIFAPEFHAVIKKRIERMKNENVPVAMIEEKIIRLDGIKVDVEVVATPFTLNGESAVQVVLRDISSRKSAEEELRKHRDHLEELVQERTEEIGQINNELLQEIKKKEGAELLLKASLEKEQELSRLKSRFISTASHEFRTPLTSVLSSAELIQRYAKKWDEEKYNEHINRIKKSVEHLTNLIEDVLTVNRGETGKLKLTLTRTDLFELCGKVISESEKYSAGTHHFSFNYAAGEKIFELDSKQMYIVLSNLMTNALKYSPEGGKVELTVDTDAENILISVIDEGIGIPEADIPRLFEPFHRSSNTESIQGTGLGLSITKHAVELHSGTIKVDSEIGKGTTITVIIPKRIHEENTGN